MGYGNFQFSEDMTAFELCLPEHTTDDEVAAFVSVLDQNLLPGSEMVCAEILSDPMGRVKGISPWPYRNAFYGAHENIQQASFMIRSAPFPCD